VQQRYKQFMQVLLTGSFHGHCIEFFEVTPRIT
jgi:hypothetical protein